VSIPGVRHPQQGEIEKGDWIWLVTRYGSSGEQIKRAKARIVDVMRKAVIIDNIEGRKAGQQTVHFNELELMPPEQQPESAPTRRKWEKNKNREIPAPISPPTLTSSLGEMAAAHVAKLAEPEPPPPPPPPPPPMFRDSQPETRITVPIPMEKPRPAPKTNGRAMTHEADEWAAQGKSVLKKKMAAIEERLREAKEEIEARRVLVAGLERELAKSREMLSLLDS
jgi:hypothetical protein